MQRFFSDLKKYNKYIQYAAKSKLNSELDGSRLGWIWWILDPVMYMLIYMFVFTIVFNRTTEYLIAFIFLGISLWKFFNNSVQGCVPLIKQNRQLISKIYLPKFALVIINMLTNGIKLAFSLLVVIGLLFYYGITPTIHMLQIIPVLLVMFLLTFALGCLVMHVGVYFEDLGNFLRPAFQLLFYASGIFYPLYGTLDDTVTELLLWLNPAALLVNEARNALLYGADCTWNALALWAVIAIVLAAFSITLIYRSENQYVKIV